MRGPLTLALLGACQGSPVVSILEAPNNRLAVIVAITEKQPVHASGRCVADDDPDDARLLDRQGPARLLDLPLAGLRNDTTWTCSVDVDDGKRVRTYEIAVEAGPVPLGVGGYDVEGATDPAGVTLLTEFDHDRGHPNMRTVIVDGRGRARWYRFTDHEVVAGLDGTVTSSGYVLTGGGPDQPPTWYDPLGDVAFALGEPPIPGSYHHHVEPFGDGVVAMVNAPNTRPDGTPFTGLAVIWFGPTGAAEWTWNSQQAVDAGTLVVGPAQDPFHANSVTLLDDPEGPAAWVSLYSARALIRVDRDTGEITHRLGPGGDFSLRDEAGAALPDDAWFVGQHDPEFAWPRVVLYDNGLDAERSRVLELELDLAARTATRRFEWTEPGWFEPLFGDADRVHDGRILVTRGRCWSPACGVDGLDEGRISDVVEVATDGSVPWRLIGPDSNRGLYRAERVDPCLLWNDPAICP